MKKTALGLLAVVSIAGVGVLPLAPTASAFLSITMPLADPPGGIDDGCGTGGVGSGEGGSGGNGSCGGPEGPGPNDPPSGGGPKSALDTARENLNDLRQARPKDREAIKDARQTVKDARKATKDERKAAKDERKAVKTGGGAGPGSGT